MSWSLLSVGVSEADQSVWNRERVLVKVWLFLEANGCFHGHHFIRHLGYWQQL